MGFFFEFDAVNNVLRTCWEGTITEAIFWETYSAAGRFLAPRPACRGITDMSGVTKFEVSVEAIKKMAATPPVIRAELMHVIVAPKDDLYGLSRMFEILSEQNRPNLHVVKSMMEAQALLGISEPQFSRVKVA